MKHAREDYTRRIQDADNLIPADEPVFLIRSSDKVGAQAVRAWAHLHRLNGGSDLAYSKVMSQADLMEQWGRVHGTKSADVPPQEKAISANRARLVRDPKIDPRVGDVLIFVGEEIPTVVGHIADDGEVWFGNGYTYYYWKSKEEWVERAKDAKVIFTIRNDQLSGDAITTERLDL